MKANRALAYAGVLLLVLALSLGGCSANQGGRDPVFWKTFVVGSGWDITSLDPGELTTLGGAVVTRNVYENLVGYKDNTTEIVPVLATDWTVSPDGLTYTFNLRRNVKFHDGEEFTSEAVKVSFERMLAMNLGPANSFKMLSKVETPEKYVVKMTLKAPFSPFLGVLAARFGPQIISPKAIKEQSKDGDLARGWLRNHEAGTGPYQLKEWTPGEQTVMTKFPDYWGGWGGKHVDTVILKEIREAATQKQALLAGDLDVAERVLTEDMVEFSKNPDISVTSYPGFKQFYIFMHCQRPWLKDVKVRQAISYAIDYDGIVNYVMAGLAVQSQGPLPRGMWAHDKNVKMYKRDVEKAKQLLAEAGYTKGSMTLKYMYLDSYDFQRQIGEVLQKNLAEIGIGLEMQPVTVAVGRALRQKSETSPDLWIFYNTPQYGDPDAYGYYMFSSTSFPPAGANWGWYKNPQVDKLLDSARTETDSKAREQMYIQVQSLVVEDAPAIFLMNTPEQVVSRAWVKGLVYNMMDSRAYNFYRVWKEPVKK